MDELRDRIAETLRDHGTSELLHDLPADELDSCAQTVIDALGLHHVEGVDGEWRVVSAWQDTERPF